MFTALLNKIKHPETRQVLLLDIDSEREVLEFHTAFRAMFPNALFFSDDDTLPFPALPLNKTREYLGLTTSAVMLDIRRGFPLDYFLSIAATIAAGGILVLLGKEPLDILESQRFHDTMIETPYFDQYRCSLLTQFAYQWQKGHLITPQSAPLSASHQELSTLKKKNPEEQQQIMTDFLQETSGIFTLFSARGSGKSWLGSKLIEHDPHRYILTAPNQNAIEQYQEIAGLQFRAPDALFLTISEEDLQPETLIIEEAAKMPLAHLERLCRRFSKVLMISSVENYEGTGQGLRAKIQDLVEIKRSYQLHQLKRFFAQDPIKQLCDAFMLQEGEKSTSSGKDFEAMHLPESLEKLARSSVRDALELRFYDDRNMAQLRANLSQLRELYHLLNQTHYQTNIQDLRRLFDAPSQVFVLAYYQNQVVGAIWAMEEGGLTPALTDAVFRGLRRPKGNLVAQMLTGQSYFREAMLEKSVRISRISVVQSLRRLGIGQMMVSFLEQNVQAHRDFMSVSFGLTKPLLQFWESMDYELAHLGFHLDKTTGLHSAVVLKVLSKSTLGSDWIAESFRKFRADAALNIQYRSYRAEILQILQQKALKGDFDQRDQVVIDAFYQFKRAKHTVENAFLREKMA